MVVSKGLYTTMHGRKNESPLVERRQMEFTVGVKAPHILGQEAEKGECRLSAGLLLFLDVLSVNPELVRRCCLPSGWVFLGRPECPLLIGILQPLPAEC